MKVFFLLFIVSVVFSRCVDAYECHIFNVSTPYSSFPEVSVAKPDSSGRIVVGGSGLVSYGFNAYRTVLLERFTDQHKRDVSFRFNATLPVYRGGTIDDFLFSETDNSIIAVGLARFNVESWRPTIYKFKGDGSADQTFGEGGAAPLRSLGSGCCYAYISGMMQQGRLLVSGRMGDGIRGSTDTLGFMVRLDAATGKLDPSFNVGKPVHFEQASSVRFTQLVDGTVAAAIDPLSRRTGQKDATLVYLDNAGKQTRQPMSISPMTFVAAVDVLSDGKTLVVSGRCHNKATLCVITVPFSGNTAIYDAEHSGGSVAVRDGLFVDAAAGEDSLTVYGWNGKFDDRTQEVLRVSVGDDLSWASDDELPPQQCQRGRVFVPKKNVVYGAVGNLDKHQYGYTTEN